ncbi:splicing factor U2AF 26 kDa subunit isoform X3 [Meles meles]|uniref:splicing factor U2AF 26 kDa subunit isoform X3 n=1 Tax=Meles meles TaxID=9662 RepID=UPI001E6A07DE|nr:splicing factor U2AF 26 kDa subunit isoform X3 [Meles meles]
MPQRCTHAPSGTPVVILRGGRRPRIRQSSRQFLSACCVSGGSDELHFPMLLSNGNDVKSRQSWRVRIGACRHGDQCSRLHNKPTFSQTIVLLNLYQNPQNTAQTADGSHCHVSDVEVQEHYDNFFEEVFTELQEKYGKIEEMNVCDNLGDHLVGNVYVKFRREEDAERAVAELNNRWFNGQAVHAELSPVTDFRESCCRQYEMGECTRGGFCNFMHLRPISLNLRRQLYGRGPRRRSPPRSHTGHRP